MKITLLVDLQEHKFLKPEFGLALLLENAGNFWLFDTGSDWALSKNLTLLQIPPEKYSHVILSHGHYDHTGGLATITPQKIFCCRNVEQSHFSFHAADDIHDISMPDAAQKILRSVNVTYIDAFTEIAPGIWLTGPIPRRSFEDCGGKFFSDAACTRPDNVAEEQALLTAAGTLIFGCCHAGLINTVEYCRQIMPDIKIRTVIGGLHLRKASDERLQMTAEYIRSSTIERLFLMHCTGDKAVQTLQDMLPEISISTPALGTCWEC